MAIVRKNLNLFISLRIVTMPHRCTPTPHTQVSKPAELISCPSSSSSFLCSMAPSPPTDAYLLWNLQLSCKFHSADVPCSFHMLYVLAIRNLLNGLLTFVTVTENISLFPFSSFVTSPGISPNSKELDQPPLPVPFSWSCFQLKSTTLLWETNILKRSAHLSLRGL